MFRNRNRKIPIPVTKKPPTFSLFLFSSKSVRNTVKSRQYGTRRILIIISKLHAFMVMPKNIPKGNCIVLRINSPPGENPAVKPEIYHYIKRISTTAIGKKQTIYAKST